MIVLPECRESRALTSHGEVKCQSRLIAELLHVFLEYKFQRY